MSIFHDEKGKGSFTRWFLAVWSVFAMAIIVALQANPNLGAVLTFCSALLVPAILIVGGKSAMQYLGPQLGAMVRGVAEGAKAIRARREQGKEWDCEQS